MEFRHLCDNTGIPPLLPRPNLIIYLLTILFLLLAGLCTLRLARRQVMVRFACPHCGKALSAPDECAGRVSMCKCGGSVIVPKASGSRLASSQVIRAIPFNPQPPSQNLQTPNIGDKQGTDGGPERAGSIIGTPVVASPLTIALAF